MTEHRWADWPGAWCLDCGALHPRELAGHMAFGVVGIGPCQIDPAKAHLYNLGPCPEPGSNRHNPYKHGPNIET